jgi:hypothetical protein
MVTNHPGAPRLDAGLPRVEPADAIRGHKVERLGTSWSLSPRLGCPTGSPGLPGQSALHRVPVPGTGRYRPVMSFFLCHDTDWPTGPGRLLLEFHQRPTAARVACGAISSVLSWQQDGPWPPDGKRHGLCQWPDSGAAYVYSPQMASGMGCASGLIREPHMYTYYFFRVLFSPCDPSGRHRALPTNGSGEPGTGPPIPVPVPVRQPRRWPGFACALLRSIPPSWPLQARAGASTGSTG